MPSPAWAVFFIDEFNQPASGDIHIPGIKTFAYAKVNAALVVKTPEEVARRQQLFAGG
jgi:hypothetical protein